MESDFNNRQLYDPLKLGLEYHLERNNASGLGMSYLDPRNFLSKNIKPSINSLSDNVSAWRAASPTIHPLKMVEDSLTGWKQITSEIHPLES